MALPPLMMMRAHFHIMVMDKNVAEGNLGKVSETFKVL